MEIGFVESKVISSGRFAGNHITEYGDIYSKKWTFRLKTTERSNGLLVVCCNEFVHILVARTFKPMDPELPFVLHKDGNLKNNHKDNLVWSNEPDLDHGEFKRIPGFSNYGVSKQGIIKSYCNSRQPRIIATKPGRDRYHRTCLKDDSGKRRGILAIANSQ